MGRLHRTKQSDFLLSLKLAQSHVPIYRSHVCSYQQDRLLQVSFHGPTLYLADTETSSLPMCLHTHIAFPVLLSHS